MGADEDWSVTFPEALLLQRKQVTGVATLVRDMYDTAAKQRPGGSLWSRSEVRGWCRAE